MRVRVSPRVQTERWSLYWHDSMDTSTQLLPDIELELGGGSAAGEAAAAEGGCTVQDLLAATARAMGWRPVDSLTRLPGYKAPWERVILQGRELPPHVSVAEALAKATACEGLPAVLAVVRVQLRADGWKIAQVDDFLACSSDDDT